MYIHVGVCAYIYTTHHGAQIATTPCGWRTMMERRKEKGSGGVYVFISAIIYIYIWKTTSVRIYIEYIYIALTLREWGIHIYIHIYIYIINVVWAYIHMWICPWCMHRYTTYHGAHMATTPCGWHSMAEGMGTGRESVCTYIFTTHILAYLQTHNKQGVGV